MYQLRSTRAEPVQQADPFKKESPHPNRARFQLVEFPEIVFCISLPGVYASARCVWYSRCLTRECGSAAAWIYVCLNSCGNDALSLLFTRVALLCILWIVGRGTGFSPGKVMSFSPQAFCRHEGLDIKNIFFMLASVTNDNEDLLCLDVYNYRFAAFLLALLSSPSY